MSHPSPTLSIGLAVRNGRDVIERCVESVLSQDFTDLELVICDNVSDDGTIDALEEYARADRRIRFAVNPVNIGLHENVKRVLSSANGTFFRWISADDWLEPGACRRACGPSRKARCDRGDNVVHHSYARRLDQIRGVPGRVPQLADPARRFERMLWFFHAGDAKYDPIYGIFRRDQMMRSHLLRPTERPTGY